MTELEIDELVAYDTKRWTQEGIAHDVIATRNASTRRYFRMNESPFAQAAARLASKIKGTAPGTPIDAEPVVIEGQATPAPCSVCGGFEWISGSDGKLKPCTACGAAERILARQAASMDQHSSQNGRAAGQTFDTFEIAPGLAIRERLSLTACLNAVQKFAAEPAGWIVIHGPPGNGKSHLAAAAYNKLKTRAKPTIYITAPELLASLMELFNQATAHEQDTTYDKRLGTFKTVPVLILDDLGAHHDGKGWAQTVLFEIMDARYRNRLPTLITMNLSPDDPRLGDRVADRLNDRHDGFSAIYHNQAPSHRRA